MGLEVSDAEYQRWVSKGLIPGAEPDAKPLAGSENYKLAPSFFALPGTWVIGCGVPSLANERDWRVRNRIAQAHRKAVSRVMGKHLHALPFFASWFHSGCPLRVKLTRLGGKALDRTANLPASLKYIEDAVALMIGADDGAANWLCECQQEPGGPCGVRIELERVE